MEYEVHFYSSGAMEEDWTTRDLGENFAVAAFGSLLGAIITIGLLALGALVFLPRGIFPNTLSTTIIAGAFPFATKALVLALLGTLACLCGAALETAPGQRIGHAAGEPGRRLAATREPRDPADRRSRHRDRVNRRRRRRILLSAAQYLLSDGVTRGSGVHRCGRGRLGLDAHRLSLPRMDRR